MISNIRIGVARFPCSFSQRLKYYSTTRRMCCYSLDGRNENKLKDCSRLVGIRNAVDYCSSSVPIVCDASSQDRKIRSDVKRDAIGLIASSVKKNGNAEGERFKSITNSLILMLLSSFGIYAAWSSNRKSNEAITSSSSIGHQNVRRGILSKCVDTFLSPFTVNAAKPMGDENDNQHSSSDPDKKVGCTCLKPGSKRKHFNIIADVLETVQDAVVCIEVKDHSTTNWFGIPQASSNGSGFIIKEDGLILTNAHVVASQQRNSITVKLHDGRCYTAFVEDVDYESDLATVRVKARGLPTLQLGCSSDTRIGEWVVAVGSPLNLANTVTAGVVSSTRRGANELGIENDLNYIQTDAAITFGNSGGPLINLDGEAIGINSMKVTAGISFAIPIDHAKQFLQKAELRRSAGKSKASRRYMGITILSLTDQIRKELEAHAAVNIPDQGAFVWQIVRGGPAHLSGLQPGDVITSINGKPTNSAAHVYEIVKTDDELVIEVHRGGKTFKLIVVPENILS